MLKLLYGILTAPLSLPFTPIVDYLVCVIIGEMALHLAYKIAGELGATAAERKVLHWISRFIVYFVIWALIYLGVTAGELLVQYWYWVALVVVALFILSIGFIIFFRGPKEKKTDEGE